MKKMIVTLALTISSLSVFAETSISQAQKQAAEINKNQEQVKLVNAISCVKFGSNCPTSIEQKNEIYQIINSEVRKVVVSGTEEEAQEALDLLDLATVFRLYH